MPCVPETTNLQELKRVLLTRRTLRCCLCHARGQLYVGTLKRACGPYSNAWVCGTCRYAVQNTAFSFFQ